MVGPTLLGMTSTASTTATKASKAELRAALADFAVILRGGLERARAAGQWPLPAPEVESPRGRKTKKAPPD